MSDRILIEGVTLDELRALAPADQDALLAFGRTITFHMGSAELLAEFNRDADRLVVNLAHIDGGGEGVLISLWKIVQAYAEQRGFVAIRWNVHAATCATPNPRLQRFLRRQGFEEVHDPRYGHIFARDQALN